MRKQLLTLTAALLTISLSSSVTFAVDFEKLDRSLSERVRRGDRGTVSVIIRTQGQAGNYEGTLRHFGARLKKNLTAIDGMVVEMDAADLEALSHVSGVEGISEDAVVRPFNDVTVKTVGADIAWVQYAVDGRGIGVAVLDSGVSQYGDDLHIRDKEKSRVVANWSTAGSGNSLVSAASTGDYFGHGTHVAGIIAGNGEQSQGILAGIAPRSQIINVKVLGDDGSGYVSDVIEGIQWVIQNRNKYNIRVINLSLGHPVTESYKTDPLAQACEAAVRAGIVVVVAAGNYGKDESGNIVYGGITSPGNDPVVITVGATKSRGTAVRSDDAVADFSSRGPTAFDLIAKPDIVAPGNRAKSLADPSPNKSDLFDLYPQNWVSPTYYGEKENGPESIHYFTMSGTSMAAPVVSGTVALMLDANPNLTPNLVKAILMSTAQDLRFPFLTQGAGYLNTYGAVMLAENITRGNVPVGASQILHHGNELSTQNNIQGESILWGGNIIWGNQVLWGGMVENNLPIWDDQVAWGSGNVLWSSGNVLWSSGNVLWSSGNVLWSSGNVLWSSGNVLWSSGNVLWSSSVLWGGNLNTNGSYFGASGVTSSIDPVSSTRSLWSSTVGATGNVLWSSGNVLWSSGNVLWSSSLLITGEN